MDLWGSDLGRVTAFRTAMEKARDLGKPITVRPRDIAPLSDLPDTYAVFHPIYHRSAKPQTVESRRRELRGFCAEIFQFNGSSGRSPKLALR
jgi:hypothetical protein